LHEVERAKGMVEAVVDRARIYEVAQAELADSPEALYPWVVHDFGEIRVAELDEPIDRVIQQLGSCGHGRKLACFFARAPPSQNNCDELPLKET